MKQHEMSFLQHLEVLRKHLIRAIIAIGVFTTFAFINKDFVFKLIFAPKYPDFITNHIFYKLSKITGINSLQINNKTFEIININMSGQLMSHIWVSIIVGIIISMPYVIWELWKFVKPALHQSEQKHVSGIVFYLSILFIIGVLFGYYLITPLSINFLSSYSISNDVVNQININSYMSSVSTITLASGLVFELPIIVYILSKLNLLTPKIMHKYRKHAYVVLLIISAIITPPDIFSQILICIPLVLLYEVGIIISSRVNKQ